MRASISALVLVPVMFVSAATQPNTGINGPVTITIQSAISAHPVRLAIVGSGLAQLVADSLQTVADSLIVWTPAGVTIGAGAVHVLLRVASGEPRLLLSSAGFRRLEVWGDLLELRRDGPTRSLQVLAPAMRTAPN